MPLCLCALVPYKYGRSLLTVGEAVKIEQLGFSYPDGTAALDNVTIAINQSEKVGIVGANGAGKSTLVNHLNGYFLTQKGSIHINGIPP